MCIRDRKKFERAPPARVGRKKRKHKGPDGAAGKLPGVDPMDFDLNTYVMEQILGTLGLLLRAKEAATRACPGDDATDAVKQIFGAGQPDPAELIMSLVLVPKGDPRQFVFGSEKADGFSPFSRAS